MNKTIVICCPGDSFSGKFVTCLTNLVKYLTTKKFKVLFSSTYSRNIYEVRNKCLLGKPEGGKDQPLFNGQPYDYILWLDDDVVFSHEDFETLYKEDKDVMSGLYLMANGTHFAAVEYWDEDYFQKHGSFQFIRKEDVKTRLLPFKVEYVGFGFLLVKAGIFEQLDYPWFDPTYLKIHKCSDFSMEDVSLCLKLKNKKIDVFVNPDVIVGHLKPVELKI